MNRSRRQRPGLSSCYLLACDQPLLADEALAEIRAAAREAGCEEFDTRIAERGFDWHGLEADLATPSLFASQRLLVLRLPTGKPGKPGGEFLAQHAKTPVPDVTLVVVMPAPDKDNSKSAWFKALRKHAECPPLREPNAGEMPGWVNRRLKAAGLAADEEGIALIARHTEGNLLAAAQAVQHLALMAGPDGRLDNDIVRQVMSDGARFDVFQLADAALDGDAARAARILDSLWAEGVSPVLMLWSLAREALTLADLGASMRRGNSPQSVVSGANIWPASRRPRVARALARHGAASGAALLASAAAADRIIKGARRGAPRSALMELAMNIAGPPLRGAETLTPMARDG